MNRSEALVAVCVLAVLVGSSTAFAAATDSLGARHGSEQIALAGQTGSVDVTVLPETYRISRDQPMTFVVHVVSASSDAIFLGFTVRSDAPVSFEFHHPAVRAMPRSWMFSEFDFVGYIPATEAGTDEFVPVTVSPDEKFPHGESVVEVRVGSRVDASMARAELAFQTRCPVSCRVELFAQWFVENLDLLVALAGLLIAFFGRKKIWAAIRASKRSLARVGERTPKRDE
ncbi:hypothetical protein [Halorussus amylolyticus]|uniref:hypothetical protein n=1 Tax=Halorussus amylolyticus TaxID=1126242 RepID=UPI0010535937|nr:hypothetical protein [Halorussus amylolyticus]